MLLTLKILKLRSVIKAEDSVTYSLSQHLSVFLLIDLDVCVKFTWCFFKLFNLVYKHFGYIQNIMGMKVIVTVKYAVYFNHNYFKYQTTYFSFFSTDKLFNNYDSFMKNGLFDLLSHNKFLRDRYPLRGYFPDCDVEIPFMSPEHGSVSTSHNIILHSLEIRVMFGSNKKL